MAVGNAFKQIGQSIGHVVSSGAKLTKDLYNASNKNIPKKDREAAQQRANHAKEACYQVGKSAWNSAMPPINTGQKYLNAKKEILTQASEQLEKAIETDNVGRAIDALTPVAHIGLEAAPILKAASVLTKATTQLAASTAKKAATTVTSTLKAAETLPKAALPKAPKAPKAGALNTTASELSNSKNILNAYAPKTAPSILPAVGLAEERVLLNTNKLSAPITAAIAQTPLGFTP